ncbi:hypothetical protein FRC02_011843, partial [Tulasnella sp. 418]
MRRRINKFVDKVLDKSRSPSPSPGKSKAKHKETPNVSTEVRDDLGGGHKALKEKHQAIRHDLLKDRTGGLLEVLEHIDTTADKSVWIKLDHELGQLSDTIRKAANSPEAKDKMDALAGNIESATKETQSQMSQDSSGRNISALRDTSIVQTLVEDIRMAIEAFNAKNSSKSEEPKASTSRAARVVSGRVVAVLKVVKESLDGVPVPGLKGAIGGLVGVLEAINKLVDNEDDLVKLIEHITGLVKIITPAPDSETHWKDEQLQQRVANLATDINQITEDAKKLKNENFGNKLVDHSDNASAIAGLTKAMDQAIDRFQVAGSLSVETKVVQLKEGIGLVGDKLDNLKDALGQMQLTSLSAAEEAALNAIQPRADSARYDSISQKTSSFCLPNTRVALLEEIFKWANDSTAKQLFWLNGMAGTGKTTIART